MSDHDHVGVCGFPMRGRLIRQRPWLSDTVWIAHESLPGFAPLAALLTHRGMWTMTKDGPTPAPQPLPADLHLDQWITEATARSVPAVVEPVDLELASSLEDLAGDLLEQTIDVLDDAGTRWTFNHSAVHVAAFRTTGWTWRLATPTHSTSATLIGIDHKHRPRFALASLTFDEPDQPPAAA